MDFSVSSLSEQPSARLIIANVIWAQEKLSLPNVFSSSFHLSPKELSTEISSELFLRASKRLLDEFVLMDKNTGWKKISILLDGDELILEQVNTNSRPHLQISYRNNTEESTIPMTLDAWAIRLIDHLKNPDSELATLYGARVDALSREQYAGVSCENRDFSHVVFRPDEISHAALAHLGGANFEGADVSYVNLSNSNLDFANFNHAIVDGTNFAHASLKGCTFVGVELNTLGLTPKQLSEANLQGALLHGNPVNKFDLVRHMVTLAENGEKDLRGVDFTGAYFHDVDLSRADLRGADLTLAIFTKGKLTKAKLNDADLTGAIFRNIDLRQAKLIGANLTGAQFTDTPFNDTNFSQAKFKQTKLANLAIDCAQLSHEQLSHVEFDAVTLEGHVPDDNLVTKWILRNRHSSEIDISKVSFSGADLSCEDLSKTNWSDMDFSGANLTDANIDHCVFTDTNLKGCKLSGIELGELNLTATQLNEADLSGAFFFEEDASTIALQH